MSMKKLSEQLINICSQIMEIKVYVTDVFGNNQKLETQIARKERKINI